MRKSLYIVFLLVTSIGYGQPPNKTETYEYIRNKLLSYGNYEGVEYLDISFDKDACILRRYKHSGVWEEIFIGNLDASSVTFGRDFYETTMTIASKNGTIAGKRYPSISSNTPMEINVKIQFRFKDSPIVHNGDDVQVFKDRIGKAMKRLIELCGGKVDRKDPFDN